jgi:hypothetical protein
LEELEDLYDTLFDPDDEADAAANAEQAAADTKAEKELGDDSGEDDTVGQQRLDTRTCVCPRARCLRFAKHVSHSSRRRENDGMRASLRLSLLLPRVFALPAAPFIALR